MHNFTTHGCPVAKRHYSFSVSYLCVQLSASETQDCYSVYRIYMSGCIFLLTWTIDAVSCKCSVACTEVTAISVCATCVSMAIIAISTLINICEGKENSNVNFEIFQSLYGRLSLLSLQLNAHTWATWWCTVPISIQITLKCWRPQQLVT